MGLVWCGTKLWWYILSFCQLRVCFGPASPSVTQPGDRWLMAKAQHSSDFPARHPPDGLPTDTNKRLQLTSVVWQLKRGFQCNCPAWNSAFFISFQTTPSSVSVFWFSFHSLLCFSPFTVCLFCLLCFMCAASDASKLVKPDSEAHTAPCFHKKLYRENLLWLNRSDTYITVGLVSCTLSDVRKPTSKWEWEVSLPFTIYFCTYVHLNTKQFSVSITSVAVCDPRLWCHTHSPFDPSACLTPNEFMIEWVAAQRAGGASVVESLVVFMRLMMASTTRWEWVTSGQPVSTALNLKKTHLFTIICHTLSVSSLWIGPVSVSIVKPVILM